MAEWLNMKQLQDQNWGYFSWGIIGGKWIHVTPLRYATDGRNWRVVNGALTCRDWFYAISEDPEWLWPKKIRGITSNGGIYVVCDQKFYEVDVSTWAFTERSSVGNRFANDVDVNMINFWKNIICLSWDDYPWVYNTSSNAWAQLTSSNIESWANPHIWAKFLYGTYVAGTGTKNNVLYISRWVTTTHPEYAYDWVNSAEKLELQSPIEWIVASKERLYIFTEETIEILTAQSLLSTWWATSTYTIPIGWENRIASHRSVVVADNIIFFLTKDNQIKTISYVPGITENDIWTITNRQGLNIEKILSTLDADQSWSFGYFHKWKSLVKFNVKEWGETMNTLWLVYDLTNDNFYVDDNKYFSCVAKYNGKYYAWSDATPFVYIDEIWGDDDGWPIVWYRNGAYRAPWLGGSRTEYREAMFMGQIGADTDVNFDILIDDVIKWNGTISWSAISSSALGSEPIAYTAIWWEYEANSLLKFEKSYWPWDLRARGNMIQVNLDWSGMALEFAISWLAIWYLPLWDTDKWNKL